MHHDLVDQTSHKLRFIYWIWQYISFCNWPFTWHTSSSFLIITLFIDYFFSFGFLVLYLKFPYLLTYLISVSISLHRMLLCSTIYFFQLSFHFYLFLSTVFRPSFHTPSYTCCIKCSSHNVIPYPWQVFYTSSFKQDNAVLLKVVTDSWDICCNFHVV